METLTWRDTMMSQESSDGDSRICRRPSIQATHVAGDTVLDQATHVAQRDTMLSQETDATTTWLWGLVT